LHHQDARYRLGAGDRAIGNQRPSRPHLRRKRAGKGRHLSHRVGRRSYSISLLTSAWETTFSVNDAYTPRCRSSAMRFTRVRLARMGPEPELTRATPRLWSSLTRGVPATARMLRGR